MNHGETADSPWLRSELVASWREVLLVVFTFSGYYFGIAVWAGVQRAFGHPEHFVRTDHALFHGMADEAIMLAAMLAFLRYRGWTLTDLRIRRDWSGTILGIVIAVTMLLIYGNYLSQLRAHGVLAHHPGSTRYILSKLTFWVMVLHEFVNAYYEELIMVGYALNQVAARLGPAVAVVLIVLLRVSHHLYQDPIQLPIIAVHFLLTALIYCWTRNLWPLILSHALYDIWVLAPDVGS